MIPLSRSWLNTARAAGVESRRATFCGRIAPMEPRTSETPRERPSLGDRIVMTPGVRGGKPRIADHRITVSDVAIWHERMGMSADEIVSECPTITLSDVYAALAYYHDHREE